MIEDHDFRWYVPSLRERFRFWWRVRRRREPMRYDARTGEGVAVRSYSPLSDETLLHYSRFGYVVGAGVGSLCEWEQHPWPYLNRAVDAVGRPPT